MFFTVSIHRTLTWHRIHYSPEKVTISYHNFHCTKDTIINMKNKYEKDLNPTPPTEYYQNNN